MATKDNGNDSNGDDDGTREICGTAHWHVRALPPVRGSHFRTARELADALWQQCIDADIDEAHITSIAGLTAALLTKRIAVRYRIPSNEADSVAAMYIEIAHRIIEVRRAEAREAN